jgi:hypothetical protein
VATKQSLGFVDGPAISDDQGKILPTQCLNDSMHEVLEEIFESAGHLFPPDVSSKEIMKTHYQAFRTFRKTSDTRAIERKVSQTDIDVVNRWESVEQAKGLRPSQPMRQHYAQLELLIEPFLRYTWKM